MSALGGRVLPICLLAGLSLMLGIACKRPETALRERPVQRVEVVQAVEGMTPEEVQSLEAQLRAGFGAPKGSADPANGSVRVFRLTLKGGPNSSYGRGLGKTMLVSTGYGIVIGALLPAVGYTTWATWKSAATAAGAGGLLGLGYGPVWYRNNQTLLAELGYLPWHFTAEWDVLERRPGLADEVIASRGNGNPFVGLQAPHLDLGPHLKPLPAGTRSQADIRRASLRAYGEALAAHFRQKR